MMQWQAALPAATNLTLTPCTGHRLLKLHSCIHGGHLVRRWQVVPAQNWGPRCYRKALEPDWRGKVRIRLCVRLLGLRIRHTAGHWCQGPSPCKHVTPASCVGGPARRTAFSASVFFLAPPPPRPICGPATQAGVRNRTGARGGGGGGGRGAGELASQSRGHTRPQSVPPQNRSSPPGQAGASAMEGGGAGGGRGPGRGWGMRLEVRGGRGGAGERQLPGPFVICRPAPYVSPRTVLSS